MKELIEIKEILQNQEKKINDIHFSIYGNEKAGIKGIACIMNQHEKYINKDKKFKWAVAGGMMSSIGGLWAYIKSHLGI